MGNAQVMTAKVAWDNAAYWSVTALLFFQRRLRRPEFMVSIDPVLRRFFVLHARMQQLFRAWGNSDQGAYGGSSASVLDIARLRELQGSLDGPLLDDDALRDRLTRNYAWLESMASAWQQLAAEHDPNLGRFIAAAPSGSSGADAIDLSPLRFAPLIST
jgi:hypothetical protein